MARKQKLFFPCEMNEATFPPVYPPLTKSSAKWNLSCFDNFLRKKWLLVIKCLFIHDNISELQTLREKWDFKKFISSFQNWLNFCCNTLKHDLRSSFEHFRSDKNFKQIQILLCLFWVADLNLNSLKIRLRLLAPNVAYENLMSKSGF